MVYVTPDDGYIYALNATNGELTWRFLTSTQTPWIMGPPVFLNDTIYIGADNGVVYALNATSGKEIWSFTTSLSSIQADRACPLSTPVIANGVLYVGSYNNQIYSLNATSGSEFWGIQETSEDWGYSAAACYAGGAIYIGSNYLLAVNASNGANIWSYTPIRSGLTPLSPPYPVWSSHP
jgi:outer membrane protein assembly factor BamB